MGAALAAANHLTNFKVAMMEQYTRAPHLDYLDRALMEVVRFIETGKGIQRLIVEMPPRHGKSLTVSQYLPAWFLGRNPHRRVILASYSASLAEYHARVARNLVQDEKWPAIFPTSVIQPDLQRAEEWGMLGPNGQQGAMVAVGFNGTIIGKGAHLLIIDDPVKNRQEAESALIRQQTWDAYSGDLMTRFDDGKRGAQIIMAQRYHTDDLIGRILSSKQAHLWSVLKLPALAESRDLLGREVGAALWPDRFDEAYITELADTMGAYAFSAQYQQTPIPRGELVFDTQQIEIIEQAPALRGDPVRFWDLAVTTNKRSDYTVGLKLGLDHQNNVIVLDVMRDKLNAPALLERSIEVARRDGAKVAQLFEGEKAGRIHLDNLLADPRMNHFPVDVVHVQGDKNARALSIQARVAQGRLKIVRGVWNTDFLEELALFPAGKHDDQVDALSGAFNHMSTGIMQTVSANVIGNAGSW